MAWTAPRTWVAGETLTASLLNTHLRDNLDAGFAVGSLHWRMQAATSVETTIDGLLLEANGTAVSRSTYAALNTKLSGLGYPFGSGDGSTTFNLPDLRGRAPYMVGSSGAHADVNALGDSDGVAHGTRTPKHNSTDSLTITGAPGGSFGSSSHTHQTTVPVEGTPYASAGSVQPGGDGTFTSGGPSATASPTAGTLAVGGTVGPGGTRPDDTPSYLVVGVMGVKY